MTTVWGIHNDHFPAEQLVKEGFISIGWDEVGDLSAIGDLQDAMRGAVRAAFPDAKDGSIPGWAGTLRRFAFAMEAGDLVIAPDKQARAINIGRLVGPYRYAGPEAQHAHRRDVEWLVTGLPRSSFSQPALNEIGSATTLFEVRTNALEFLNALAGTGHSLDLNHVPFRSSERARSPHAFRALGTEYLRAMCNGDSVFTPGRAVWSLRSAEELVTAFVDRPDEGGRSFDEKLDDQLGGVSDEGLQLFAELWCMSIAPLADYTPTTKRQLLKRVLNKMRSPAGMPPVVEEALDSGAFAGGVAFKTRRPFQLALLVRIAVALMSLPQADRETALSAPRPLESLLDSVTEPNEPAQRRGLRWLLFPNYYLPIVSDRHRTAIRTAFAEYLDRTAPNLDAELHQIRQALSDGGSEVKFYEPPLIDRWDPDRTLSGVPVTADKLSERSRFKTAGYAIATAALNLVPEGFWTTYSDVAEAAGLTAGQIGEYTAQVEHPAGHRVIKIDGTTYPQFAWLPEGVTPRQALEAEGIEFDERGVADPARRISKDDMHAQLDELGHLPKVARRAWLVRGNNVNGRDLVPGWLSSGSVELAATNLREVAPGITREELKTTVDEDYSFASYAARAEKLDEFHNFLTRMQAGHLVVTIDQGVLYVGEVVGDAQRVSTLNSGVMLTRPVRWAATDGGVVVDELQGELKARLTVQRDVLDLTEQLPILEGLLTAEKALAPPPAVEEVVLPAATPELARELHVEQEWLQKCVDLLNDRPQLIFYGPPGTGKTYIAQKLARHVAGDNVRLVQFHPAYAYEDFFEGFRPLKEGGFDLKPGPMRRIVDQAIANPAVPHVLIIDEINRGNLAKVFGELYFLLEYRDQNVELLYSDGVFSLPRNVYIIGTMNTADRSIALVDAAMRRRFAFLPLHPSEPPTSGVLRSWLSRRVEKSPLAAADLRVADLLEELNRRIDDTDFKIGPSYFMREAVYGDGGLGITWETAILPLLEEHHYGQLSRIEVEERYGLAAIDKRLPGAKSEQTPDEDADDGSSPPTD